MRVADLLEANEPLREAQTNRSRIEFFFTCSPCWPWYLLHKYPHIDLLTYVDADINFFHSPEEVFDELGDRSVGIIEHRFAPHLRHAASRGIYNVGWLSFRNDEDGLACLNWWQDRCIEWCYDRLEDDRYADQKYLDVWPTKFKNVAVLQHKGANLAPWNLPNYVIRMDRDGLWVDDQRLIFYHFHALKQPSRWFFNSNLSVYGTPLYPCVRNDIYAPYVKLLQRETQRVMPLLPKKRFLRGIRHKEEQSTAGKTPFQHLKERLHYVKWLYRTIRAGDIYLCLR
ncbi:MAG: glycosyl transferase [Gemmataceae bacterium]